MYAFHISPARIKESMMAIATVKDEARRMVERLSDDATWEDIQHQIQFRQAVEAGEKDSQEGRVAPPEKARRCLGSGTWTAEEILRNEG